MRVQLNTFGPLHSLKVSVEHAVGEIKSKTTMAIWVILRLELLLKKFV